MGLQRLELGVRFRKLMLISVKICYRSVWDHPFLVGLVCFFMFLYTSFPLLFSALVTASPVLVCTAVLLGTLLSFGSPHIPEIDEKEEKEEERIGREVSELKTGATEDHTVVERDVGDDDFVVERHVGKGIMEKVNSVDNEVGEVEEDSGSIRYKLLVDDDLDTRDIHCEDGVIDEAEGSLSDSLVENKREIREVILGGEGLLSTVEASDDHHVLADVVGDSNLEVEHYELKDLTDEQRGDESDSSFVHWKHPVDDEDDGVDDDESMDSDSDGAESYSPDASMADIIPMLDELHPLLISGAAQPAHLSDDGSDASSERSHGSTNDESSDIHGEEDGDEGEGGKGDKEDESKSAIKWTDDDEKNLMDLGISELERNQRLGNLIARRRARKNMRLMLEKNLIDLDGADIPLNITPISTTRRNPFEFPYDSYDDLGLPPIPGSAPSIMQPRRNPFDLPYDPNEEKPDLKGDSFQEEFAGFIQRETVPQREAFLRRHESFNVGPSSLGVNRQELKWKPFFALEQLATGGCSPSSFRRQWSEVSESKLSSLPDTESVFSVVDEDDKCEQDISQETELIANEDRASFHEEQESRSSGDVEAKDVEQVENRVAQRDVVEITLGDGESQLETESNLPEPGATAHVELYGIEIEATSHVGQADNRDVHHDVVGNALGDEENMQKTESTLSETGTTTHVELNPSEIHPNSTEPVDEDFSSRSSLSSLSEIGEKISDVREGSAGFEPRGHEINESDIFTQPSFEESEFHFTSRVVDDNRHSEPVYDSSPSVEKVLSFSSVSSETQAETLEMSSRSMLVESTDREPEGHGETTEQGTSSFQEIHTVSSNLLENEPTSRDHPEISECDVTYAASSGVSSTFADHDVSMVPESVVEYVPPDAGSSSSDEGSQDGVPNKEERFIQNQVDLLSLGAEMNLTVDPGKDTMFDSSPEEQQHSTNPKESSEAELGDGHAVDKKDTELERDEIHSSSSSEHDLVGGGFSPNKEITQIECDQMHFSNFDASLEVDGPYDKGEELPSTDLSHQHMPSDDVSSSTAEEPYHIVVAQVSQLDPSEANLVGVLENESEMDQVQPACSDSKTDTSLDRDMNLEGIPSNSSYEAMPSGENPSPDMENQLSGSDNYTDEPPIDEHDKLETESRREVDIGNNDDVHKVHEPEYKLSTNYTSITSESTSHDESPEHTLPTDREDMKDRILNEMEHKGGPGEISEHFNRAAEVYATCVDEENITEEDDEIREIYEGILSELDTVGDFNVEKIDLPEGSRVAYTESAPIPKDMKTETNFELPILDARSVEDIDSAFKQLHEEVILPSMIENQQDHADTNPNLPVLEARSPEDTSNAFQQGPESNSAELLRSSDIQNGSSEVEHNDADSAKEIEASNAVASIQENSKNAASEQINEYEEASEKSSLNLRGKN